jgi:hypothetical protein
MDQPIRPRQSNHHKPRIRPGSFMGLWPTFNVSVPTYTSKRLPDGRIEIEPAEHVLVDQKCSIERAFMVAEEAMKVHPLYPVLSK